jgi:N-acetylglucosamine repressor
MTGLNGRAGPALLRHLNGRAVLAALQRHGPLSRAEITRHTGVSGPTVTRVVADLLRSGLLEEGDARPAALGRPGKVLRLAGRAVSVLGLAIGARQCELVAAGLDGEIRPECVRTFVTPARYGDLVRAIVRYARRLGRETGTTVLGLGVSMPGLLNRWEGRTVFSPNLHQTDGRCLGEDLRRHLGGEVALLQELHALCLAEQTYGAARGVADFAMLEISEGLGLGVVQDGRFIEGHSGLAGELGHITVELHGRPCGCGNCGCLETVATDTALAACISERLGRAATVEEVVELAQAGKLKVGDDFERVLQYLAVGLAAVINIFNPHKLFVHGRFLDAAPHLTDRLLALTRRRTLAPSLADCEIVRARGSKPLGAVAGIVHRLTTGRAEPVH